MDVDGAQDGAHDGAQDGAPSAMGGSAGDTAPSRPPPAPQPHAQLQLLHAALRLLPQPTLLAADLAKQLSPALAFYRRTDAAALGAAAALEGAPPAPHEASRPNQSLPPTIALPPLTPVEVAAAAIAAERGHAVTLHERDRRLGGQVLLAQLLPGRAEFGGIVANLEHEARRAGVRIVMGSEVTADLVKREAPDALILATGARPRVPVESRQRQNLALRPRRPPHSEPPSRCWRRARESRAAPPPAPRPPGARRGR